MLLPMIAQSQPYREDHTLIPADAGYHSDANVKHLQDHNIPALIADNQMRSRDERFESQTKYKDKPDPLSEKKATGQAKDIKRFGPKEFCFNDDNRRPKIRPIPASACARPLIRYASWFKSCPQFCTL